MVDRRDSFDSNRTFTVTRPVTLSGKKFREHDPFDKAIVSLRRLRLLYEQRVLQMADAGPAAPQTVDPAQMSDHQLTLLLEDNGTVIRPNATRQWLIERASKLLNPSRQGKGRATAENRVEGG